jgi:hypothetical protein
VLVATIGSSVYGCHVRHLGQGRKPMSDKDVRVASETFYAALNRMLNGNAASLAEIWSHSGDVTTLHPIGAAKSDGTP